MQPSHVPSMPAAIIASAEFFIIFSSGMKSYNILIEALLQNPNSKKLTKAYVKECIEANLISYALKGLETLKTMLSDDEFNRFYIENESGIQRLQE